MALCSSFKLGKPLSFWSTFHLHRAWEKLKQEKSNRTDMMAEGKGESDIKSPVVAMDFHQNSYKMISNTNKSHKKIFNPPKKTIALLMELYCHSTCSQIFFQTQDFYHYSRIPASLLPFPSLPA